MTRAGVVAFAFGVPETLVSNQRIAQMTSQKAQEVSGQVYTQRDVRVAPGVKVQYTEEEPGNPPPTLRIARGAVRWAKQLGFNELWIACAKPHLWRCRRDLEYAVREANARIPVRVCEEVEQYPEAEWFCPSSTQPRVRTREDWRGRERVLELMPMFLYKRVAS